MQVILSEKGNKRNHVSLEEFPVHQIVPSLTKKKVLHSHLTHSQCFDSQLGKVSTRVEKKGIKCQRDRLIDSILNERKNRKLRRLTQEFSYFHRNHVST